MENDNKAVAVGVCVDFYITFAVQNQNVQTLIMTNITRFRHTVVFILAVHLSGLLSLSLLRLIHYFALRDMSSGDGSNVLPAFLRGLWFDNVVACYITAVPLVVLLAAACSGCYHRLLRRGCGIWAGIFYTLAFAVSAANIPYFRYFFKTINSGIFEWFGYAGTTAGMVVGELSYLPCILLFLLFTAGFWLFVMRLCRRQDRVMETLPLDARGWRPVTLKILVSLSLAGLCVFGIRGRLGYNPIKVSQAYYCTDPFLNQLGIAPAFNLLTSALDDMRKENAELRLMPVAEAVTEARRSLNVTGTADSAHVLRRRVEAGQAPVRRNVVIILMESMSASLMGTFGHQPSLTPVLDSLSRTSLMFTRCYSAGIHTNHGITASLYSFPALMKRNLMKGTVTPRRSGIPTVLRENGYRNMFFMTHEAQYDNMNAFLRTNGYDEVYAQEDYPSSEVVNSFGVPDRYLFSYALGAIDRAAARKTPFMATLLTVSNHPPYVLPSDFPATASDDEQRIVEYADDAIGRFLSEASRRPWYANTVFVLLADHGKLVGQPDAELPQSYNHIPMLMFGPGIAPGRNDGLAMQVDLMPTLLSVLGMSYDYDGFGVDLLAGRRDKVFYSADDQIVARDSTGCYIYCPATGHEKCYDSSPDGRLTESPDRERFEPLRRYVFSMIQTAEFVYRRPSI